MNQIENIISEYGKQIYSFCVYITGDRDAADDLYQQTFLVAIEKGEIKADRNPKSYLITIAMNLWNNQKRKFLWRRKKADVVYFEEYNDRRRLMVSEPVYQDTPAGGEILLIKYDGNEYGFYDWFDCVPRKEHY